MAIDVKILGRSRIHGGGYTTTGIAKNDKEMVWAQVSVTAYTNAGEPFIPSDMGLTNFDALFLDLRSVQDAVTEPISGAIPMAAYSDVLQVLVINIDHGADTAVTDNQAAVVNCLAIGDSASQADLT